MTRPPAIAKSCAAALPTECAREYVITALRVLVAWNDGCAPDASDLHTLRSTFPAAAHIPHDQLASQVIQSLSPIAFPRPT